MPVISKQLRDKITFVLGSHRNNCSVAPNGQELFNQNVYEEVILELNPKRGRPVGWRKVKPVPEGDIPPNNVIDN